MRKCGIDYLCKVELKCLLVRLLFKGRPTQLTLELVILIMERSNNILIGDTLSRARFHIERAFILSTLRKMTKERVDITHLINYKVKQR